MAGCPTRAGHPCHSSLTRDRPCLRSMKIRHSTRETSDMQRACSEHPTPCPPPRRDAHYCGSCAAASAAIPQLGSCHRFSTSSASSDQHDSQRATDLPSTKSTPLVNTTTTVPVTRNLRIHDRRRISLGLRPSTSVVLKESSAAPPSQPLTSGLSLVSATPFTAQSQID